MQMLSMHVFLLVIPWRLFRHLDPECAASLLLMHSGSDAEKVVPMRWHLRMKTNNLMHEIMIPIPRTGCIMFLIPCPYAGFSVAKSPNRETSSSDAI